MTDPSSLTISIDRTSLSLSPLVLSGSDNDIGSGVLGITGFREPAMSPSIRYAPSSRVHGDLPLSWRWQQSVLAFEVAAFDATSEQQQREAVAELVTALARLSYTVTITVDGAPAETWACNPGTVEPRDDRAFMDLRDHNPKWDISIPAYPIRTVA